jgi:hypothetical protein
LQRSWTVPPDRLLQFVKRCPLPLPNGRGLSHDGCTGAEAPTALHTMAKTYQFPNSFIEQLCNRYLPEVDSEAWDYAFDRVYEACRIHGPRYAVTEARYYADFFSA